MAVHYGNEFRWRVDGMNIDTDGAVTLELVHPWSPPPAGDDGRLVLPRLPALPQIAGYQPDGGRWKRTKSGGMEIAVDFKGLYTNDDSPSFSFGDAYEWQPKWSASGNFRGVDIRLNPNFAKLKGKYGWDEEKEAFPEVMTGTFSTMSAWISGETELENVSPVYGVTSFDQLGVVVTRRSLRRTAAGLFRDVGKIVRRPPWGELEDFGENDPDPRKRTNWRIFPPSIDPHGLYYRAAEHWVLGVWNTDIYEEVAQ